MVVGKVGVAMGKREDRDIECNVNASLCCVLGSKCSLYPSPAYSMIPTLTVYFRIQTYYQLIS